MNNHQNSIPRKFRTGFPSILTGCALCVLFLIAMQASAQAPTATDQSAAGAIETAPPADASNNSEKDAAPADSEEDSGDEEMVVTVPKQEGVLRYGADLEGGVPYVFQSPEDEKILKGFEVEILDYIANKLGKKLVHVQNDWDKLIPGLTRDLYDIAVQGLEITPEHEDVIRFSIPYYITGLQLAVRKDEFLINSLSETHGKIVGTLKESVAFYILESMKDVDIRAYPTEVNGFDDLVNGRLDATLFDAPVALYYGGPRPEVKFVGEPIGRIIYGIAIPKDNPDLQKQINDILTEMRGNGELRRILDRWNMWNSLVAAEFQDFSPSSTEPVEYNQWVQEQHPVSGWQMRMQRYVHILPIFARAAKVTMEISILAMLLAIVCGFLLATIRVYAPQPFSFLAVLYIEIIRGTPVLIQLFFIFYGLPSIGIKLSPFIAGIVGLGMNYAAYEAENYRAGFIAVPHSQMEAALGLAMTRWQAIRYVIAPQAFRVVLPPVTNDFISLLKDSSLVSVITMVELTKAYGQVATTYYDYFGTGLIVAFIYLLLGLPFVRLARWMEKKMAVTAPRVGLRH